jgi:hypothetical protein
MIASLPKLPGNLRRIAANAASLLASDVINRATTFALYALVARSLGAYEFGQLSLALTLFYTFQILAVAGLKTLVTREIAKHRERTDELLVNGSVVVLATALASMAMLGIFVRLMGYDASTARVILLLSAGLIPYALSAICEAVFQGWERMRLIAIANIPVNVQDRPFVRGARTRSGAELGHPPARRFVRRHCGDRMGDRPGSDYRAEDQISLGRFVLACPFDDHVSWHRWDHRDHREPQRDSPLEVPRGDRGRHLQRRNTVDGPSLTHLWKHRCQRLPAHVPSL